MGKKKKKVKNYGEVKEKLSVCVEREEKSGGLGRGRYVVNGGKSNEGWGKRLLGMGVRTEEKKTNIWDWKNRLARKWGVPGKGKHSTFQGKGQEGRITCKKKKRRRQPGEKRENSSPSRREKTFE